MVIASVRRRVALARRPASAARIAAGLWIAWAVVVWNVVFDHVVVMAGRRYVHAAGLAARALAPPPRMDDWMRPAVTNGVYAATAAAGAILIVGLLSLHLATRATRLP
jgi:hypothetical protein